MKNILAGLDWTPAVKWARRWTLPSFFYGLGTGFAVAASRVYNLIGWRSNGSEYSYDVRESLLQSNDLGFFSGAKSVSEAWVSASESLQIPVVLILAIMFLVLAYKLTPKAHYDKAE